MNWRIGWIISISFILPLSLRAEPLCVSSSKAILRKGPGTQFPVTWTVGQYMPLNKVGQKGSWVQVEDLDGQKHWVSGNSVTTKYNCVVIKTKTAPLRQGPGSKFPTTDIAFADRYTPFKKVAREDAWLQLQDEYQGKYWVHESNIWFPVMRAKLQF